MITICKTILSGTAPGQIRDQASGLVSAPLRDLAVKLAADPDLTVSVITYSDGRHELEVLHTGPPHHTEDTVDHRSLPARPFSHRAGRSPSALRPACRTPSRRSAPSCTPPPADPADPADRMRLTGRACPDVDP